MPEHRRKIEAILAEMKMRGHTALLLIWFFAYSSGWATMVARSGISDKELYSIPSGLTRQELLDRFGTPLSSVTAESGRQMEVFRIRRQLEDFKIEDDVACYAFAWCWFFLPIFFAHTVVKSQTNRVDVAFIYGPDGRSIYSYPLIGDSERQYFVAISRLAHPVLKADAFENCESASACIERHIAELRLRALETGYKLDAESETLFQRQIEIARGIDDHKITREDAIKELLRLQTSQ